MFFFFLVSFLGNIWLLQQLEKVQIPFYTTWKKSRSLKKEEEKIGKEVITLIDFLKSYLNSGLVPIQCVHFAIKQRQWGSVVHAVLESILNHHLQGKSLEVCLTHAILMTQGKATRRHLNLLLLSLRLGCASGSHLDDILEKVKKRTEEKLLLDQKIKTMTAQIRMQAMVISFAPLFLAVIIFFVSPDYVSFFFFDTSGRFLLVIMLLLNLLGLFFLKKLSLLE